MRRPVLHGSAGGTTVNTMDKRKKVLVSVSAVVLVVLVIVLLMLLEPWQVFTDQRMEDPRSMALSAALLRQ